MRTAKYKWQDYKTKEDILSELKINPVVNNPQNFLLTYLLTYSMEQSPS
jgi:hypothetical protein